MASLQTCLGEQEMLGVPARQASFILFGCAERPASADYHTLASLLGGAILLYNPRMLSRRSPAVATLILGGFLAFPVVAQSSQPAAPARTLLLPHSVVSGERATLAVLDVNGRLTPGVTVNFSNGDRFTTDATGRALFVAPLTPGVMFGTIGGGTGRIPMTILTPAEAASSSIEIISVPPVISLADRFEISGRGFCGDADLNQVVIGNQSALVLASSPVSLILLPPVELNPGSATVEVSCAQHKAQAFRAAFVSLELEADSSPLKPGERRLLKVQVRGTTAKIVLEARILGPKIAELVGGNIVKQSSSGGAKNEARFELIGRTRGNISVAIRLVQQPGRSLER